MEALVWTIIWISVVFNTIAFLLIAKAFKMITKVAKLQQEHSELSGKQLKSLLDYIDAVNEYVVKGKINRN